MNPLGKKLSERSTSLQSDGNQKKLLMMLSNSEARQKRALAAAEHAFLSQSERVAMAAGLGRAKDNFLSAQAGHERHQKSGAFLAADATLSKAQIATHSKDQPPTPNARALLPLSSFKREVSSPADLNTGDTTVSSKVSPTFGALLAFAQRVGTPTAIGIVGLAGLNSAVEHGPVRWGFGGAAIVLAAASIGLRSLSDAWKLQPWQNAILQRTKLPSDADLLLIQRATEQMIDSYAAGFNWFAAALLSLYRAKENLAAASASGTIFLVGAAFAYRAALPNRENWTRPAMSALGALAAIVGASVFLSTSSSSNNGVQPDFAGDTAHFQSGAGFPVVIGLLAAASHFQEFSANRAYLKDTRTSIDSRLMEKRNALLDEAVEEARKDPALEMARGLNAEMDTKRKIFEDTQAAWDMIKAQEESLLEHLKILRDEAKENLAEIQKQLKEAREAVGEA